MEKKNITFAPNVILLDVAFLNGTIDEARKLLSQKLARELPATDLVNWLMCLALDGGLRRGGNEVQVLLVADDGCRSLQGCTPSTPDELDGKACQTPLGEFAFSVVNPADMVPRAALFTELAGLALDAKETERLLLVPDFRAYGDRLERELQDFGKEAGNSAALDKAICFLLEGTENAQLPCRTDLLTYSLMHVWGIAPDDL